MSVVNLTPTDVATLLAENKIVLIDVREPQEYLAERIPGALLFPLSTFDPAHLPEASADRPLVFHCAAGGRSGRAAQACLAAGLPHGRHLAGGIGAWKAAKLPYLKIDPASGQVCEVC
jgi:rhodanese-related sulfurtransferase